MKNSLWHGTIMADRDSNVLFTIYNDIMYGGDSAYYLIGKFDKPLISPPESTSVTIVANKYNEYCHSNYNIVSDLSVQDRDSYDLKFGVYWDPNTKIIHLKGSFGANQEIKIYVNLEKIRDLD